MMEIVLLTPGVSKDTELLIEVIDESGASSFLAPSGNTVRTVAATSAEVSCNGKRENR